MQMATDVRGIAFASPTKPGNHLGSALKYRVEVLKSSQAVRVRHENVLLDSIAQFVWFLVTAYGGAV